MMGGTADSLQDKIDCQHSRLQLFRYNKLRTPQRCASSKLHERPCCQADMKGKRGT